MSKNEKLFKLAQEYGFWSKVKDVMPGAGGWGKGMRSLLSGEYKEKVKLLEETDETVRKILMGDNSYNHEIKDMLFYLEQSFLDKKHMDMAHYAAGLSKIVQKAVESGKEVSNLSQEDLAKYYGISPKDIEDYLSRADQSTSMADHNKEDDDVQNALLMDIARGVEGLVNNISVRRLYRKLLSDPIEWLYKKDTRERTRDANELLQDSKAFVQKVLEIMNTLKTHRRSGNISEWVTEFSKLNELEQFYNKKQKEFYNKYIKPIMDKLQSERAKALEEESAKKSEEELKGVEETPVTTKQELPKVPDLIPENKTQNIEQPAEVINTDGELVKEQISSPIITPAPKEIKRLPAPQQPAEVINTNTPSDSALPPDKKSKPSFQPMAPKTPYDEKQIEEQKRLRKLWQEKLNEAINTDNVLEEKKYKSMLSHLDELTAKNKNIYSITKSAMLNKFNTEFGNALYKLAAQKADKEIIAALLVKHSDDIEDLDPEASLNLLKCAEKILNG